MKANPGRVVGPFKIGKNFSVAYGKAATTAIASSGFAQTGIYPLNSEIFPDDLFMPSLVSDQPHAHVSAEHDPVTMEADQAMSENNLEIIEAAEATPEDDRASPGSS
ncbi:hypothetical protein QE152_g31009 [Popillia japonica]|uniref:Uncharacterized protein n=1 Tax=Popillia japonica TaxID=7064 RepID=A0AAW1JCL2_POPJA